MAGDHVQVQLYDLPADYQLALYGPGGQWLDQSSNKKLRSEEIRYTAATAGEYFLRVLPRGSAVDAQRPYTLRVTQGGPMVQAYPGRGVPGEKAHLHGEGFEPVVNQSPCEARVYWNEVVPARFLGTVPIQLDGSFDLDVDVPADATTRSHRLRTQRRCGSEPFPPTDAIVDIDPEYADDGCVQAWPPALPDLDLAMVGMEVTQGIQCFASDCGTNSVPLVAGRPTVVRVYTSAGLFPEPGANGIVRGVTAVLYARRQNEEAPGTALWPANGPIDWISPALGERIGAKRDSADDTLNFLLPADWLTGSVVLHAVVNPDWACGPWESEERRENNRGEETIAFEERNGLRINYVPIHYTPPEDCHWRGDELPSDAIGTAWRWMYKVYPLGDHPQYEPWAEPLEWNRCISREVEGVGQNSVDLLAELNERWVFRLLAWIFSGLDEAVHPPHQLVGWLPAGCYLPGGRSDAVYRGGYGLVAYMNDDADIRGKVLAHEMGHNMGMEHPDDPDAEIGEYGFDVARMEVKDFRLHDLMTPDWVTDVTWISPTTFQYLFDVNLRPPPAGAAGRAAAVAGQLAGEAVLISGAVSVDGRGELRPMYLAPGTGGFAGPAAGTTYCLEWIGGAGEELHRRCFDVRFESDYEPTHLASFFLLEPYPTGTARIRLTQGATMLDEQVVTPNAPQVTVLSPNGGEQWGGVQTITWQASDADGDGLEYAVFYSPDDGRTWRPVAQRVTQTSVQWDTSHAGGSNQGRIRVVATDGINTSFDDSDGPFRMPLKPPTAEIASPDDGASFRRPEAVLLLGRGVDLEDGELRGDALVWRSGRDGVLGTGNSLVTPDLSRGQHLITLSVTDADGMSRAASVTIHVGSVTPIPACVGDCNEGGGVTIDEIITGINIALGLVPSDQCTPFDSDASGTVTVDELLQGVHNALNGCG